VFLKYTYFYHSKLLKNDGMVGTGFLTKKFNIIFPEKFYFQWPNKILTLQLKKQTFSYGALSRPQE
jgi:hypothetical protein